MGYYPGGWFVTLTGNHRLSDRPLPRILLSVFLIEQIGWKRSLHIGHFRGFRVKSNPSLINNTLTVYFLFETTHGGVTSNFLEGPDEWSKQGGDECKGEV